MPVLQCVESTPEMSKSAALRSGSAQVLRRGRGREQNVRAAEQGGLLKQASIPARRHGMDFALSCFMSHHDLLHRLRANGGFTSAEQADAALSNTLETLGYLLPRPLAQELTAALPHSCIGALQTAIAASDGARRLAHAQAACIPSELTSETLHEMENVCGALFSVLSLDMIRKLDQALPPPLMGIFTRYAVSVARPSAASSQPQRLAHRKPSLPLHEVLHIARHGNAVADE